MDRAQQAARRRSCAKPRGDRRARRCDCGIEGRQQGLGAFGGVADAAGFVEAQDGLGAIFQGGRALGCSSWEFLLLQGGEVLAERRGVVRGVAGLEDGGEQRLGRGGAGRL